MGEPARVELDLSGPQYEVFWDEHRFRVLVAGRRFGKTHLVLVELMRAAASPGVLCFYVFPTYRQAKQVAWIALKAMAWRFIRKANETDLSVELVNGSTIALRGADNYDSLRGVGLDFLAIDEYADMDPSAWTEVLRPALADRLGRALFVGTPKGWNHFKELFDFAQDHPDWRCWSYTTLDGGNVDAEEVAAARAQTDERTFRQEFEASFESPTGRVYYNFSRVDSVTEAVKDEGGTILVGMDFNVDPMTCVIGSRVVDQLHLWNELHIPNFNTEGMARELVRLYRDRDILVCPDPSGNSRRTSAPVGQTDFAILRKAGFRLAAPSAAPPVVDRINEVNALLQNADGVRRLFIHPSCRHTIRALDGLTYKEGTGQVDKSGGLDHITDALGYLVHQEFPIISRLGRRHALPIG